MYSKFVRQVCDDNVSIQCLLLWLLIFRVQNAADKQAVEGPPCFDREGTLTSHCSIPLCTASRTHGHRVWQSALCSSLNRAGILAVSAIVIHALIVCPTRGQIWAHSCDQTKRVHSLIVSLLPSLSFSSSFGKSPTSTSRLSQILAVKLTIQVPCMCAAVSHVHHLNHIEPLHT